MIKRTVAVLGDPHLHGPWLDIPEGQRGSLVVMAKEIKDFDPHLFLIAGDLTGHTVPHRASPAERMALVDLIRAVDTPTVAIRGNHDAIEDHMVLNHLAGCGVSYHEQIALSSVGGCLVVTLPWIDRATIGRGSSPEDQAQGILDLWKSFINSPEVFAALTGFEGPRILLAHMAFKGGVVYDGQPSVPTTDPLIDPFDLYDPRLIDVIVSGHYHKGQIIAKDDEGRPFAWYVGSAFASQYGETASDKAWMSLSFEGRKLVASRFHSIPQPRRIRVDFDPVENVITDVKGISQPGHAGQLFRLPAQLIEFLSKETAHVKLVPHLHEGDVAASTPKIARFAAAISDVALSIRIDPEVKRTERVRDGAVAVAEATTLTGKVDQFASSGSDLDVPEEVLNRAKEILDKVEAKVDGGAQ